MSVILDKNTIDLASMVIKLDTKRAELRASYRKLLVDLRTEHMFVHLTLGYTDTGFEYYRSWRLSPSLFPNKIKERNEIILEEAREACNTEYLKYKKLLNIN